jgi:hypothetical protein
MQTAEKVFWLGPKPDILIAEIQGDKKRKEADVNEDIAFLKDQMGDRKCLLERRINAILSL